MGHIFTLFRDDLILGKTSQLPTLLGMSKREENVYASANKIAHLFCGCLLRVVGVKCHVILPPPPYRCQCRIPVDLRRTLALLLINVNIIIMSLS